MFSDVHSQVQLGPTVHIVFILLSELAFARNSRIFKFRAVQLSKPLFGSDWLLKMHHITWISNKKMTLYPALSRNNFEGHCNKNTSCVYLKGL